MVAHSTMRTYGVNQEFRFDEGIWLHRKSGQIRFFFQKILVFTSCVRNVFWATILYKNDDRHRGSRLSKVEYFVCSSFKCTMYSKAKSHDECTHCVVQSVRTVHINWKWTKTQRLLLSRRFCNRSSGLDLIKSGSGFFPKPDPDLTFEKQSGSGSGIQIWPNFYLVKFPHNFFICL